MTVAQSLSVDVELVALVEVELTETLLVAMVVSEVDDTLLVVEPRLVDVHVLE